MLIPKTINVKFLKNCSFEIPDVPEKLQSYKALKFVTVMVVTKMNVGDILLYIGDMLICHQHHFMREFIL